MTSQARIYFGIFEPRIREIFARIVSEAGAPTGIGLEILEVEEFSGTRLNLARTVFEAVVPGGPVRITWDALASLWFCCFGTIRVCERLFRERRSGVDQVQIDASLQNGLAAFSLAQDLIRSPLGSWSTKMLLPCSDTDGDTENHKVTITFLGALGWILRHEMAHIVLGHQEVETSDRMKQDEFTADAEACRWLIGDRRRDQNRVVGARPSPMELELEVRTLRMGIGLLWVALFEERSGRASTDHPEIAARFDKCLEIADLPVDSFAAEILSDAMKLWVDPEGAWISSTDPNIATARAALDEALFRLQRHVQR